METDAKGRCDLRQAPGLPIELMAYVRRPEGGTILHPAIARPKRNQSDIRILFDPALTKNPRACHDRRNEAVAVSRGMEKSPID